MALLLNIFRIKTFHMDIFLQSKSLAQSNICKFMQNLLKIAEINPSNIKSS